MREKLRNPLIVFLVFVFCQIAMAGTTPQQRAAYVERQRQITLDIIAQAYWRKDIGPNAKLIYERLWQYLNEAQLGFPDPGTDFQYCSEEMTTNIGVKATNKEAFFDGQIWLCNDPLVMERDIPATIIHEAAHAIGYENECDATKIELSTMNHGGARPLGNGYMQTCKVKINYRNKH